MRRFLRNMLLCLALLLGLGAGGFHPAEAWARQSMSFSPGDRARPHAARARHQGRAVRGHGRGARGRPHAPRQRAVGGPGRATEGGDEGPAAKAVPGQGFTMENGVLTYPAPARFQPHNLRRR